MELHTGQFSLFFECKDNDFKELNKLFGQIQRTNTTRKKHTADDFHKPSVVFTG
jgi:hypothetical protein